MLFNIERDAGTEIVGYLAPDDPQASGDVILSSEGGEVARLTADEPRPALIASGRHGTGLCGFRLTEARVPGLGAMEELELRCAQTGLLIHRRAARATAQRRLMRLETSLKPRSGLDGLLGAHFRLAYPQADLFGYETLQQVLQLQGATSIYVSARANYPAVSFLLEDVFDVACAVRDPFEEMAERLLLLSDVSNGRAALEGRDRILFGRALEALDGADVSSPQAMARVVSRFDGGVAATLSNPLTRQLTCLRPSELCAGDAVSAALRALSGFAIVAPASAAGWQELALEQLLDLPGRFGVFETPDALTSFADALAKTKAAKQILEFDLEVHARLEEAFADALAG